MLEWDRRTWLKRWLKRFCASIQKLGRDLAKALNTFLRERAQRVTSELHTLDIETEHEPYRLPLPSIGNAADVTKFGWYSQMALRHDHKPLLDTSKIKVMPFDPAYEFDMAEPKIEPIRDMQLVLHKDKYPETIKVIQLGRRVYPSNVLINVEATPVDLMHDVALYVEAARIAHEADVILSITEQEELAKHWGLLCHQGVRETKL